MKFLEKITPRKYQEEILKTCIQKNCLVVLPTGLGKTLIALMLTIQRMEEFPGEKVVFLAPTKPLVQQHLDFFEQHLPELFGDMQLFTGMVKPEKRKEIWQTADIVFSTPQCVANDLRKKLYDLNSVCLLVEDECVTKDTKVKLSYRKKTSIENLFKKIEKDRKIYVESLEKGGDIEPARLLKIHKIKNKKEIFKIKTERNKEIKATEDHLILAKKKGEIKWIKTKDLKEKDEIATYPETKEENYKDEIIINEKDIIEKYNKTQQRFVSLYKKAQKIRKTTKEGSRKISKKLKISENSIKNWVHSPYQTPIPLKTIKRLKEKGLLPLKYSNPKIKLITRLIGHIHGDGWFTKKNEPKILGFSGEIEDLQRIQKDLDILEIKYTKISSKQTSSIIKTLSGKKIVVEGRSNSFTVTDSCLIKLLDALNTPVGNKTTLPFLIPNWLMKAPKFVKKEFLSSIMGSEGDIPKIRKNTRSPYAIRFRINKLEKIKNNGLTYINQIRKLFNDFDIKSSVQTREGNIRKKNEKTIKIQLTLANSNHNFEKFLKKIGYKYSYKKSKKTNNILNYLEYKNEKFRERKKWHEKIFSLKKQGINTNKAIQILSKELKIKPTTLVRLGYKGKPTRANILMKNYEEWNVKNKEITWTNWERIKKIKKIKNEKYVYDLTIEKNHNYLGNEIIVHNCHRCIKNYDYNYMARKYQEQSIHPKILGLTASPGSEAHKIKEICKNLSIEEVELRTRYSEDVKPYLQQLKFEKIMMDFPIEFIKIQDALVKLFNSYTSELRNRKVLWTFPTKTELIKLQKKLQLSLMKRSRSWNQMLAISACAQAIKIQHALELLETQTLSGFNKYLKRLFAQAEKKQSKGVIRLVAKPEFNYAFVKSNELLAQKIEHPKIPELIRIIEREKLENRDIKIIVFTQFRETAQTLAKKINKIKGIKAKVFVGQAKKEDGSGLSQKEQKQIIEEFSSRKINVLCATCIAEEGLDIPEVNVVVFYEPIPSAIRTIQRTGRTARLMKGKLIILITKKTRDEAYFYVSKAKEKRMHSAIDSIKKHLSKKKSGFQEKLE